MKEQKPEPVQKPLQGQSDETDVAEDRSGSTTGRNGTREAGEGASIRPLPSQGQKPPKPESTMHSDTAIRKTRGRLTREAMKIIANTLEASYDDLRKEGTPDRFKVLLQQLDERREQKDKESS